MVLWELITKEQTRRGNWRPVRVPEECPAAVEALIADCLTDDVGRRPSMKEVVERLVALEAPQEAASTPATDSARETSAHADASSNVPRCEADNTAAECQNSCMSGAHSCQLVAPDAC